MRLIVKDNYNECSRWVANYISKRIINHRDTNPFVLGLPTGSTPIGVYAELINMHKKEMLSFKNVVTFNMDEYVGLSKDNPESYNYFMQNKLFKYIDIEPEKTFIPDGEVADLDQECLDYEEKIRKFGGVDLFLCGVGTNGHIAFNEPFTSLSSRTRVEQLSMSTIKDNSRFFNDDISKTPKKAITIGIATIMDANEIIVMATGIKKSKAIHDAVEGAISHACPVSVLQNHNKVIFVCDNEAVSGLNASTLRYFENFANNI